MNTLSTAATAIVDHEEFVSMSKLRLQDNHHQGRHTMKNDDIVTQVISFVGKDQFRFVATLNKRFYCLYTGMNPPNTKYNNQFTTVYNVSTIEAAKFTLQEVSEEERVYLCHRAAANGDIQMLEFLHFAKGCPWDVYTCAWAAKNGHLSMIRYLHENGCPWEDGTGPKVKRSYFPENSAICSIAAQFGRLNILVYALKNGCQWGDEVWLLAAKYGHLDILKYAKENDWLDHRLFICFYAACGGHLEILEYLQLREVGFEWDRWTCAGAAAGGHLELLKYLQNKRCPWDELTCLNAARQGKLEVLEFAHKNGCPWDKFTCLWGATGGHLNVLQYAHRNGCPWNVHQVRDIASQHEFQNIVEWIDAIQDDEDDDVSIGSLPTIREIVRYDDSSVEEGDNEESDDESDNRSAGSERTVSLMIPVINLGYGTEEGDEEDLNTSSEGEDDGNAGPLQKEMILASPLPPPVEAAVLSQPSQNDNSYIVDPINPYGISCNEINYDSNDVILHDIYTNNVQSTPIVAPASNIKYDNNHSNKKITEPSKRLSLSVEGLRLAAMINNDTISSTGGYYEGYCVVFPRAQSPNWVRVLLSSLYGDRNVLSSVESKKYIVVANQQIHVFNDIIDPAPLYTIPLLPTYTIEREDPRKLYPNSNTISPVPRTNQQPATMMSFSLLSTTTTWPKTTKTVSVHKFTFDISSSQQNETENDAQRFLTSVQFFLLPQEKPTSTGIWVK